MELEEAANEGAIRYQVSLFGSGLVSLARTLDLRTVVLVARSVGFSLTLPLQTRRSNAFQSAKKHVRNSL